MPTLHILSIMRVLFGLAIELSNNTKIWPFTWYCYEIIKYCTWFIVFWPAIWLSWRQLVTSPSEAFKPYQRSIFKKLRIGLFKNITILTRWTFTTLEQLLFDISSFNLRSAIGWSYFYTRCVELYFALSLFGLWFLRLKLLSRTDQVILTCRDLVLSVVEYF